MGVLYTQQRGAPFCRTFYLLFPADKSALGLCQQSRSPLGVGMLMSATFHIDPSRNANIPITVTLIIKCLHLNLYTSQIIMNFKAKFYCLLTIKGKYL